MKIKFFNKNIIIKLLKKIIIKLSNKHYLLLLKSIFLLKKTIFFPRIIFSQKHKNCDEQHKGKVQKVNRH